MHARELIRSTVETLLTGLTTTGSSVSASRVYALPASALPALLIYPGTEQQERILTVGYPRRIVRHLELIIEGRAQGADMDDTLDQIAEEVEIAMASDVKLGINVTDSQLLQTDYQLTGEGQTPQGAIMLRYRVEYVTPENDPTTLI